MKQKLTLNHILIVIIITLLVSCEATQIVNKSTKASEIKQIAYFEPITYISLIQKGNKGIPNDSLSNVSKLILDSIIQNNPNFKVTQKIQIGNVHLKNRIESELNSLFLNVIRTESIEDKKLTPTIDSILKVNKQRFALALVTTGFARRKGNYGNQIAKGVGIGILTLGLYAPVPIKANTNLFTLILDSEKQNISFFSKTIPIEESPVEKKNLEYQYKKLFNGYLYNVEK